MIKHSDCLKIIRKMESKSVDLIYLDPPFNSNRIYINRAGKEGKFSDVWKFENIDVDERRHLQENEPKLYSLLGMIKKVHSSSMLAYLAFMSIRLIEMKRILKDTGNIYLHCDSAANHYLRMVMDNIFGKKNFRNEIIWHYIGISSASKQFPRKHDTILFYSSSSKIKFNVIREKREKPFRQQARVWENGILNNKRDKNGKSVYRISYDRKIDSVWDIFLSSTAKERTGYPTQKPLALLERIVKASSNKGDLILDPFCGSGTTLVVAKQLGRKYIGIDISEKAISICKDRLRKTQKVLI